MCFLPNISWRTTYFLITRFSGSLFFFIGNIHLLSQFTQSFSRNICQLDFAIIINWMHQQHTWKFDDSWESCPDNLELRKRYVCRWVVKLACQLLVKTLNTFGWNYGIHLRALPSTSSDLLEGVLSNNLIHVDLSTFQI